MICTIMLVHKLLALEWNSLKYENDLFIIYPDTTLSNIQNMKKLFKTYVTYTK